MMSGSTYVIAEIGVNHNGSLQIARDLVESAAECGADAAKFQTFRASEMVTARASLAKYQRPPDQPATSQLEMLRALELDVQAHEAIAETCRSHCLDFLSTPFDFPSVELLLDRLGLSRVKISSGDLTNGPLLFEVASRQAHVILSTGMATLAEVEDALGVLALGYAGGGSPSRSAFREAFSSPAGQIALSEKVTLLHCTSAYPALPQDVNLRAMDTLLSSFGLRVGYSDHTNGIAISLAAVARGAQVIEKHFTLDTALPGPDHKVSLDPAAFGELVRGIRQVEQAIGSGRKVPVEGEMEVRALSRKSLVAKCQVQMGETLTQGHIGVKRPGTGISPMEYWDFIGRLAEKPYAPDEAFR